MFRISLGLASLTVSLLLAANALHLIPDRDGAVIEAAQALHGGDPTFAAHGPGESAPRRGRGGCSLCGGTRRTPQTSPTRSSNRISRKLPSSSPRKKPAWAACG